MTTIDMSLSLLLGPQLRAFRDAGYEVIGASAPGPYVEELQAAGIRHVPLRHATRSMAPVQDLRLLLELRSLFLRLRPDIVHTHNPKPNWFGRTAARAAGVPAVVNTVHGLYATPGDPWPRRTVVYALERLAGRWSHAELVQNPEDIPVLTRLGLPATKLHLLGNGIDLDRFDPDRIPRGTRERVRSEWGVAPDEVVCGAVGRLVWEKGYRELFDAVVRLRRSAPRARVVVVGPSDPAKADAVDTAEIEHAERNGVRFLGMRHDVHHLYAAMDVYVLASHREGFPRSAMEAAAMGLPIVATDIRGCRQVVDDGATGYLVPVRRADALAEAIAALVEDPRLRERMGQAARRKAAVEFDQRRVIATTLAVYRDVLAGQARVQVPG